jgi:hypothetical protein
LLLPQLLLLLLQLRLPLLPTLSWLRRPGRLHRLVILIAVAAIRQRSNAQVLPQPAAQPLHWWGLTPLQHALELLQVSPLELLLHCW